MFKQYSLRIISVFLLIFVSGNVVAQHSPKSPSYLLQELEGLLHFRRALYVAAHPDDENTRLISYLEHGNYTETAYISLTRGSGGQNLIGSEKGDLLGAIRSHELLAARSIDQGQQFFTSALDFGYSKTSEETFEKWNKETVLQELVHTIRYFKPDVMITRFPPNKRAGHGHHAASAILAEEAFKKAADPNYLPNVKPWQVSQLYFNTSTWWIKDLDEFVKSDSSYLKIDVGGYNAHTGKWNGEIASESRSMHKSQGFGSAKQRGEKFEYLQLINHVGAFPSNGINTGRKNWTDYPQGSEIQEQIERVIQSFDIKTPEKSIPSLIKLKKLLEKLPDNDGRILFKINILNEIILNCTGLYLSLSSEKNQYTKGAEMKLTLDAINPSNEAVNIKQLQIDQKNFSIDQTIINNQATEYNFEYYPPDWLFEPTSYQMEYPGNLFHTLEGKLTIEIANTNFTFKSPVKYQWVDRVKGEQFAEVAFLPDVLVSFSDKSFITKKGNKTKVEVKLESISDTVSGEVQLNLDTKHWRIVPEKVTVDLVPGVFQTIEFEVEALSSNRKDKCVAMFSDSRSQYTKYVEKITYDHIPELQVLKENQVNFVSVDIDPGNMNIAYIPGAGDEMVASLRRVGYQVDELQVTEISTSTLQKYDAVICGIRAYNTNPDLFKLHNVFLNYMESGGNFIVQYNTSRRIDTEQISPYILQLSRKRVTDEYAEVEWLVPEHKIFNSPLKLSETDFEAWVQERGLYFPDEWGPEFTPLISWSDKGEEKLKGALLVADYGKGSFIYTGISFFRQLPAGVPGAYRLFSNLIHYSPNGNP